MKHILKILTEFELRRSLFIMSGTLLVLFLFIGFYGLSVISREKEMFQILKDSNLRASTDINRILLDHSNIRALMDSDLKGKMKIKAKMQEYKLQIEKSVDDYRPLADTEYELQYFKKWRTNFSIFTDHFHQYRVLVDAGKRKEGEKYLKAHVLPYFQEALVSLEKIAEFQSDDAYDLEKRFEVMIWKDRIIFLILLFTCIFVGFMTTRFITARITRMFKWIKEGVERLDLCVEAGAIGIWDLHVPEQEVILSEVMKEMLQIDSEKMNFPAKDFFDLIHPEDVQLVMKRMGYEGANDFIEQQEYRIYHPDRSVRWISSRANFFTDNKGHVTRIMGVSTDITERREAERLLQEIQRQKIEALSKMSLLGEITGGIAHEINNPLTVITLASDQLDRTLESENFNIITVKNLGEKIRKNVASISKIVSGLRVFLRNGTADPFVAVSVKALIDETMVFCTDKFARHSVKLIIDPIAEDLKMECRQAELSQVIVNLLNNAVDAIKKIPEPWVRISTLDLGENRIEISIVDSGLGIPSELLKKMFRWSFTTKPIGQGTGLGLGICRRIVESHRGNIFVDEKSHHTKFVMSFPKAQPVHEMEQDTELVTAA